MDFTDFMSDFDLQKNRDSQSYPTKIKTNQNHLIHQSVLSSLKSVKSIK